MLTSLKSFLTGCICSPPLFLSGQVWRFPKSDRWGAILLSQPTGANATRSTQHPAPPWVAFSSSALQPRLFPNRAKEGEMQIHPVWHLRTQLQGPEVQFGRDALVQGMKGASCLVRGQLPSSPLPRHIFLGRPWGSAYLPRGLAAPQQVLREPAAFPQDPPAAPIAHLRCRNHAGSPHAPQTRLITWTLQKQEPAFSTPKLKST